MELTRKEINRQDFVDNAINDVLRELIPTKSNLDWNIDYISQVRDTIQDIIVNQLNLCDEQSFYPYLEK